MKRLLITPLRWVAEEGAPRSLPLVEPCVACDAALSTTRLGASCMLRNMPFCILFSTVAVSGRLSTVRCAEDAAAPRMQLFLRFASGSPDCLRLAAALFIRKSFGGPSSHFLALRASSLSNESASVSLPTLPPPSLRYFTSDDCCSRLLSTTNSSSRRPGVAELAEGAASGVFLEWRTSTLAEIVLKSCEATTLVLL